MPTLLVKTGRVFLAPARKSRPVFLPLKTAPPIRRRRGFSRQSEGRHNITHYTLPPAKCVPKGPRPLWKPRRSGFVSRKMGRSRSPFPLRLTACPDDVRVVGAARTTGTGRGTYLRKKRKNATTEISGLTLSKANNYFLSGVDIALITRYNCRRQLYLV
jgi:predicted RNA-binding protein YlxR (DUF448 family)